MIDLDVTRPDLEWCYTTQRKVPCSGWWRGRIGEGWSALSCDTTHGGWGRWFANYADFILQYASLASATNATVFLIQHELSTAAGQCPHLWNKLIADVRAVYPGLVSAAFLANILDPVAQTQAEYAKTLDFIGVDCYTGPGPLRKYPYNTTSYPHPALPWRDVSLDDLVAAKVQTLPDYARLVGSERLISERRYTDERESER